MNMSEMKGINISKVEVINMLEEHKHPSNQRSEVEGMNTAIIHMVEVEGIDMVEEQLSKQRSGGGGVPVEVVTRGGGYGYGGIYDIRGGCGCV
jgi:hypothetical protein